MIYTGIYSNNYASNPSGTGFRGDAGGNDVYLDFSVNNPASSRLIFESQAYGASAMVDQAAVLILGAQLDPQMKSTIVNFINAKLTYEDHLGKVKAAVHLISTSPQAAIQK